MTTTYCSHPYAPVWLTDTDGIGRLCCATCGHPFTPKPTGDLRPGEVVLLAALLITAIAGAAWWVWWLWLG